MNIRRQIKDIAIDRINAKHAENRRRMVALKPLISDESAPHDARRDARFDYYDCENDNRELLIELEMINKIKVSW